jgi:hypothetical protein
MKRSYQVAVDTQSGIPVAEVAHGDTWELVEYLSYRRTAVFYSHCEDHLIVRFPHLNATSAQQLLNEWDGTGGREHESSSRRV